MSLVYCVEDDEGISELILCVLRSGGYEAKRFVSSRELFDALKERLPTLLLLDAMLPGENGIIILQKLKASPAYKNLPVIMLTAKTTEIDKVTGLEAGADDYITKPFGVMELLSRIKAVLRRANPIEFPTDGIISYAGLSVSYAKREVLYNGSLVELTYKEFELLYYLINNYGLVLSRDKIIERVWGFDFEGESRTIDMHIKTLRQKLEAAGCSDFIKTIRGVGYKLDAGTDIKA